MVQFKFNGVSFDLLLDEILLLWFIVADISCTFQLSLFTIQDEG